MLQTILVGLTELVYPPACFLCKIPLRRSHPENVLCLACRHLLKPNLPPFCIVCSRHLSEPLTMTRCRECRHHPPHFDFAWGAYQYNNTLKELIHAFKYDGKIYLRHYFFSLIISFIKDYQLDICQFDYLIPIPLHPTKLRERTYNQSLILSKMISYHFNIPLLENHLAKIRYTKNQAEIERKQRWTNIHGAFRIKNSKAVKEKNILLLDDLLTTGATASEGARILKEAGAKKVSVLTLAIA